jgi:hypothetical protein
MIENIKIKKESVKLENNKDIDNDLKYNSMAYNHNIKGYCYINYYNDDIIVEFNNTLSEININEVVLKLIISSKNECHILNMLTNSKTLLKIETNNII